jgi:hypothetical protein
MVDAMNAYWEHQPPVHVMVAAYMGIGKQSSSKPSDGIENASEFVPVETLPSAEFDALVAGFGLPVLPAVLPPPAPLAE